MHTLSGVEYRWDPAKAAENVDKHDVRFSDAVAVLEDDFARTLRDAYTEEEERFVTVGTDALGRLLVVVFAHRGTVDKFVGDMIMALYGAPLDDEDHAEHAVQTALAMITTLDQLNREWAGQGKPQLDIGIGINTGEMIAGNVGSDTIMSYTVIGDAVNLGARLESLNKEYGTRIIISDATRERLKGRYYIQPLGDVVVKGKTKPVAIFEVKST